MSLNTQQFGKHLRTATNVALTGAMAASVYVGGSTHDTHQGGWLASGGKEIAQAKETRESKPHNVPTWNKNLSQQFPGFKDFASKPEDALNTHIVAVTQQNRPKVLTARQAFDRAFNETKADDTWWVGYK